MAASFLYQPLSNVISNLSKGIFPDDVKIILVSPLYNGESLRKWCREDIRLNDFVDQSFYKTIHMRHYHPHHHPRIYPYLDNKKQWMRGNNERTIQ